MKLFIKGSVFFFVVFLLYCNNGVRPLRMNSLELPKTSQRFLNCTKCFTKNKTDIPQGSIKQEFMFQKLYPGQDLEKLFTLSEFESKTRYVYATQTDILVFNSTEHYEEQLVDELDLWNIYNTNYDSLKDGKCCSNLIMKKFPRPYSCKGTCPNHRLFNLPRFWKDKQEIDENLSQWTYCIEIFIFQEVRWRLCKENYHAVKEFYLNLIIKVAKRKNNFKDLSSSVMTNLVRNLPIYEEDEISPWTWENQLEWRRNCRRRYFIQSPINVFESILVSDQKIIEPFKFDVKLNNPEFILVPNSSEITAQFTTKGGSFSIYYNDILLKFQPTGFSFRFPAEHTIENDRWEGEMIIHFKQEDNNQRLWLTEGLDVVIALKSVELGTVAELEDLEIENWKKLVSRYGFFQPKSKNQLKPKNLVFKLKSLWERAIETNQKYYIYVGSETTPPCRSYSLKILIGTPLEVNKCWIPFAKENTLLSNRSDEFNKMHSRVTQNDCQGDDENNFVAFQRHQWKSVSNTSTCCDKKPPYVVPLSTLPKYVPKKKEATIC